MGSGISGLGAAWKLHGHARITIFEQDSRLGGHTNTVIVPGIGSGGGDVAVDTGFIVHNENTYPELLKFLADLGVATCESDMSLSICHPASGFEYAMQRPLGQLANRRHGLELARLFVGLVRLLAHGKRCVEQGQISPDETLGEWITRNNYSDRVRDQFLVPVCAAIWSTAPGEVMDMPAAMTLGFLNNHGILGFKRIDWRTIPGGCSTYVAAIQERLAEGETPTELLLNTPVTRIERNSQSDGPVAVESSSGRHSFDHVIIATHADTALSILADPTPAETELLRAFPYTASETILHTDQRMMPKDRRRWTSWNYQFDSVGLADNAPSLTYWMNKLQPLNTDANLFVTLNRGHEIDPNKVLQRFNYCHPRYTVAGAQAQLRLNELNSGSTTWFCGAYQRFGFHEDGLTSGLAAAHGILQQARVAEGTS